MRDLFKRSFTLLLMAVAISTSAYAQNMADKKLSIHAHEVLVRTALSQIRSAVGVVFVYEESAIDQNQRVTLSYDNMPLSTILNALCYQTKLNYKIKKQMVLLTPKGVESKTGNEFITVKGRVIDEMKDALAGVTVFAPQSNIGTITDNDGNFQIYLKSDELLSFNFIGMASQTVKVKSNMKPLLIQMVADEFSIQEVVVTGYQRISKERTTAAVGFVSSEQLTNQMHSDLSSSLEGKIAGIRMDINPNTGEKSPVLRGIGTFSSNVGTNPLIVIDDMPTNLTLNDLNFYNVDNVTVLKDAAAASIYGALAANGVIVVTTKSAKREGAHVNVNADWFITSRPNFNALNLASTSDIIDYQTDVFDAGVAESGSASGFLSTYKSNYYNPLFQLYLDRENGTVNDSEVNSTLNKWRNNDYYEEFRKNAWRTALTQRYNVSVSEKVGDNTHFLSFNYEKEKKRAISDSSNKYSLYYKSNYDITKWLNLNAGVDVRLSKKNTQNSSYNYTTQQRYEQIFDENGNRYSSPYVNLSGYSGSSYNGSVVGSVAGTSPYKSFGFNVLDAMEEGKTKTEDISIRPFVNIQASFLKMFKYRFMYQYEYNKSKSSLFDSEDSYLMRMTHNAMIDTNGKSHLPEGGRYYQTEVSSKRYTLRNQVDFDKSWNNNVITAIAGLEFRENRIPVPTQQLLYGYDPQTLTSDRMDWQSYYDGVGTSALSNNTITLGGLSTTLQEAHHRYASFYTNAAYSYLARYNVSGSIRWDEADLFGLDIKNQRHPLWSVGGSWIATEEAFMKNISWLDYLKVRMTYGINGNVDQSSTTFFVVKQKTQSNPIKSTYLSYDDDDLPNPKLRWEKTATYNIGIDFKVLSNILSGSFEYYNRYSSDLLVRRYMDPTLGTESHVVNNGEMRNRGVELSLNANIIRKKDWMFNVNFVFARNDNKMTKVDHSDSDYSSNFIMSPQNYFVEGTSYNTLWAYKIDRIENGYPIAVDKDGNDLVTFNADGTVKSITTPSALKGTDDLVNLGSLTPKINGSLGFNLSYKGFELNALFVFADGNKLRNSVISMSDQVGSETLSDITDRWDGDNAASKVRMYIDMPSKVKTYANTFNEWNKYGDINVKNAGYVKLRSLSLGFNTPNSVCKHLCLSSLKLKLQVNNLFTLCRAGNGIDPESYNFNGGTRGMTTPKTYSIGLSTNF